MKAGRDQAYSKIRRYFGAWRKKTNNLVDEKVKGRECRDIG